MTPTASASAVQALRSRLEGLLAEGDAIGAREAARELWASSPDAGVARFLKRNIDRLNGDRPLHDHRLAILRSFTVEPVAPLLEAEAALAGCRLATWVGGYNAYAQEILDLAGPLCGQPFDTVLLALQTRDVSPELWRGYGELSEEALETEVGRAASFLIELLSELRGRIGGAILCHGMERPLDSGEGLLQAARERRQADAIEAVNKRLRAWCSTQAGVYVLDYDDLIGRYGRERWFDDKMYAATRMPFGAGAAGALAQAWWRHLAPLALPPAKVLVLDLDNTLWGGILGEDGSEGVRLGTEPPGSYFQELQRAVLDIARRGILLVLASKNDEDDALAVIDSHPGMLIRREHLAAWKIDWSPKPENLAALAEELGLGLDSFVFVDDNPIEREAVRRAFPEVEVVELPDDPADFARQLRSVARLERYTVSAEDANRTRLYREDDQRRSAKVSAGSLREFLASLQIEVRVAPIDSGNIARAAQLVQKTNQLNTTTRRISEAGLAQRLQEPAWSGFVLSARDRFGDNGIVGVALTEDAGDACVIDTFLLSCRVIGRGIETAFLAHLADAARRRGRARLEGWFKPTPRNAPAAEIYRAAGFVEAAAEGPDRLWRAELDSGGPVVPDWIRLRASETAG